MLAGCAEQKAPPALSDGLAMQPAKTDSAAGDNASNTIIYRAPDLDARRYRGFVVLPATVYDGPDAEFGGTTEAERQELAGVLTSEFKKALSQHRRVVDRPGPDTVTLQLTLGGVGKTNAIGGLTRLTPVGFGLMVVKSAAGLPANFVGSVTIGGKLTESAGGKVLAGFVTKESPQAYDLRTEAGTVMTARLAIAKAARDFAAAADRVVEESHQKTSARAPAR
ncbi:conserved protein of unknown function [Rhodovastum atsumiense]|nr:conserved protein of unknown function [Rhodovastum atsumiense]